MYFSGIILLGLTKLLQSVTTDSVEHTQYQERINHKSTQAICPRFWLEVEKLHARESEDEATHIHSVGVSFWHTRTTNMKTHHIQLRFTEWIQNLYATRSFMQGMYALWDLIMEVTFSWLVEFTFAFFYSNIKIWEDFVPRARKRVWWLLRNFLVVPSQQS